MARESEDKYVCKRCGAKITRRAAMNYNGLCKRCYEKEEQTSRAIY
ncbi:MAG: hypothetical protein ACOC8Y_04160 [Candidatus Natronoplasma sp.]